MLPRKRISDVVVIIVALFVISAKSEQFHEMLTNEEFFHTFRTTRDNVPEYEVVPIMHNIMKRSTSSVRINFAAFGKKVEAILNPAGSILAGENTPVWRSFIDSFGSQRFSKMRKGIVGLVARSYENAVNITSLIVRENEGTNTLSFYGSVEDDSLRIAPTPARVRELTQEEFNRFGETRLKREATKTSPDMIMSDYHVIIKTGSFSKNLDSVKRNVREISRVYDEGDGSRRKRSEADTIYPSLLIMTDFANPKTTEDDLAYYDDIIYQLSFWNAVDLRFRDLQNPQVRLRIAGIIFGQSRSASPWLKKNMKYEEVNVQAALTAMQKFWWRWRVKPEFSEHAYNMAVSMTDLNMFMIDANGNKHVAGGLGTIGGMCNAQYGRDDQVQSSLIFVDHQGYDGVRTAAHELGHVLGASHDTSKDGDCAESFGYVMAPTMDITTNAFRWSECSKRKISDFLRQRSVTCADQPSELHPSGDSIGRILPGLVLNDHQQCQARGYYWACEASPNICKKLRCSYSGIHKAFVGCYEVEPAADGTLCGENMACVNGECTSYGL